MSFAFSKPLQLPFSPVKTTESYNYNDSFALIGSCFSDNIAEKLQHYKFSVLTNPFGVSYNPISISNSIEFIVTKKQFTENDLFLSNDLFHSWEHHSSFSGIDKETVLTNINLEIDKAYSFLKSSNCLIITLGSAYAYKLKSNNKIVANCHKQVASSFEKVLLNSSEIVVSLEKSISEVRKLNPTIAVFFTLSPVRHVRDGLIENNRSKAILLQAIHELCDKNIAKYFPAFELVNDVLRDYRFFAEDLVHPNQIAIDYVWENFVEAFISDEAKKTMKEIEAINSAYTHRAINVNSMQHKQFLNSYLQKVNALKSKLPQLDFEKEIEYFSKG